MMTPKVSRMLDLAVHHELFLALALRDQVAVLRAIQKIEKVDELSPRIRTLLDPVIREVKKEQR
jgi:hypothetical protein